MKVGATTTLPAQHRRTRDERPAAVDWVARFAEEEQGREQARNRSLRADTVRAEAVREHIHDLMDSLRDRAARDVDAFCRRLPDRAITIQDNPPGGGFIVRRGRYPEARLTVEPHPETGTIHVQYVFSSETGTLMPKMQEIAVGGESIQDLRFVDPADQQTFKSMNELSEYLLVPVFVGRPR